MIKWSWLVMFLVVPVSIAMSIDLSGNWEGRLTQGPGAFSQLYYLKMSVTQEGNKVQGVSTIYVNEYYGKMTFKGVIDGDTLRYQEIKVVDYDFELGFEWCTKRSNLFIDQNPLGIQLIGDWEGDISVGPCVPGYMELKKERLIESKDPAGPVHIERAGRKISSVDYRFVRQRESIYVRNDTVTLYFYDNLQKDGDVLSIIYNDERVVEKNRISKKMQSVQLVTKPPKNMNYIVIYSIDMGKFPPCSVTIDIDDGFRRQSFIMNADEDESDIVYFEYVPL